MRVEITGSNLVIDFWSLLGNLSDEDKHKAADTFSCDGEIIRYVTQQILDGWTEQGSHGGILCTAVPEPAPHNGLDWAMREIAKRAGEVAEKEIKRLEEALKHREEQLQKLHDENRVLRGHGQRE